MTVMRKMTGLGCAVLVWWMGSLLSQPCWGQVSGADRYAAGKASASQPAAVRPASQSGVSASVARYITDQTVAVARIDFTQIDVDGVSSLLRKAGLSGEAPGEDAQAFSAWVKNFTRAGGREGYFLMDASAGPDDVLGVIPLRPGADVRGLSSLLMTGKLSSATSSPATSGPSKRASGPFPAVEQVGDVLLAGTPNRIDAARKSSPAERADVVAVLDANATRTLEILVIPSQDIMQGFAQAMPALPQEFGGMDTLAAARAIRWIAVGIASPPKMSLSFTIQAGSAAEADWLADRIREILASPGVKGVGESFPEGAGVLAALTPSLDGSRVLVSLDADKTTLVLDNVLFPVLRSARMAARSAMSGGNINSILKGCLLYRLDHQDRYPEDFNDLVKAGVISAKMLKNPRFPDQAIGYVYIKPPANLPESEETRTVVVYEAYPTWTNGVNVGFADGHVEFIRDQAAFLKLIGKSGTSGPSTRPNGR